MLLMGVYKTSVNPSSISKMKVLHWRLLPNPLFTLQLLFADMVGNLCIRILYSSVKTCSVCKCCKKTSVVSMSLQYFLASSAINLGSVLIFPSCANANNVLPNFTYFLGSGE